MNSIGFLRKIVPNRCKDAFVASAVFLTPVKARTELSNIYHCCVYKTGSQWIRRLFSDPRLYRWSGLKPINGARLGGDPENRIPLAARQKPGGFPVDTAVTGLFMSYENFRIMPKPEKYAAFFVVRDPRELVVSWYLSTRFTHPENPGVKELRRKMEGMDDKEGIKFSIDYWRDNGLFTIMADWHRAAKKEKRIRTFFFEHLTGSDGYSCFQKILSHCRISIPDGRFRPVFEAHSAKRLSSGSKTGKYSFASQGLKWRQYFDEDIADHFRTTVPDLIEELGYEWST